MKKTINILVIFSLLYSLSACTANKKYENFLSSQQVEIRVSERWEALIDQEYTKAYAYLAKSYRNVTSIEDYKKRINPRIIWKKFELMRTSCEEDICNVSVNVGYHMPPMFGIPNGIDATDYIKETWLHQDGEWFYLPPKSN